MAQGLRIGVMSWLVGLAALASAPLLIFAAVSIYDLGQAQRASETQHLVLRGQAIAQSMTQRLGVSLGFLNALAATNAAKRGDLPALYDHARQAIKLNPDATAVSLVDGQNRLVFLTLRPFGTENLPVGDMDSVHKVFQTGKPSISQPFKAPINDTMVVAIGVPVFEEERVAYCLWLIVPVKVLGGMLAEQKLPDGWNSALIGDADIVLARSKSPERYVGQRASESLLTVLARPHGDVFESVSLEGITTLTTVADVPGWNLKVAVGVPSQTLAGDSAQAMHYLLGFGLLVIAIGALAAVWLARFIATRINIVVAASSAQNRGEQHLATSTGIREVDDALSHMAAVTQRELQTKRSLLDLAVQHQQVHHALSSARKDGLTQLPGRAEFLGLVKALHQRVSETNTGQLVVLFVDLDGFKGVNDQHGHAAGDEVLQKTADVLRDQTRGDDVIGRFGGDEFVVCLHAEVARSKQIASDVANRIVESVGAIGFGVGCSVGIAVWTLACPDLDSVIKRADSAMYEAKRRGRNQFVYSDGTE